MSDRGGTPEGGALRQGMTRRETCASAVALAAAMVATGRLPALAAAPEASAAANAGAAAAITTPAEALEALRAGNARFASGAPQAADRDLARLRALAPGQTPFAGFLGCADSRVPVEILYDQGLGDLFVVRVAGNVASSEGIASLEYATAVLGIQAIQVLGHSNCGAVKAALAGGDVPGQISTLYRHIVPALDRNTMDLEAAIAANVRYQARMLSKASTVLAQAVAAGRLRIVGGVFHLKDGTVHPVEV